MAQNVFLVAQILVMAIMAGGVWIMAKGIVREDFATFRNSLYWFLASSIFSGFMFSLRTGLNLARIPGGMEMPLVAMSLTLGFISVIGISYYYIHKVMPQVFVKAAVFFSITLLLINVLSIFPPRIGKAAGNYGRHRFMEAQKYQQKSKTQQQKQASDEIASNP